MIELTKAEARALVLAAGCGLANFTDLMKALKSEVVTPQLMLDIVKRSNDTFGSWNGRGASPKDIRAAMDAMLKVIKEFE